MISCKPEEMMFDRKVLVKTLLLITASILLTACALSPQTINIVPDISMVDIKPVNGSRLTLDIRDSRGSSIVGYRGGIYDTAAITTRDNVTAAIYAEFSRVLKEEGFIVVNKGMPADASLEIELQKLNYTVKQQNIPWKIEVSAIISARAAAGTKTVSSNFEDSLNKDFPKSPSIRENEKLINSVISKLLQRILQDDTIADLIRRP